MFVGKALFLAGLASHVSTCSFISAPKLSQQRHRSLARGNKAAARKKIHRTHCLRCAAVALAVSSSSSIAPEAGDLAENGKIRQRFVGDTVILTDWLDKSRDEEKVEVVSSFQEQEEERDNSPPHRFQELIQHMWAELSRGNQLDYLGREGQEMVKQALTVLAAYCALREHPLKAGVDSPKQAFFEMDYNRDGEVSFDEFVRWYSMSTAMDQPQQAASPSVPTSAAAAPKGEAGLPPSSEKVASNDASSRGSRLLADVEKSLALTNRASISTSPWAAAVAPDSAKTRAGYLDGIGLDSSVRGQWSGLMATSTVPLAATALATVAGAGPTAEENDAARERWLTGGAADAGIGTWTPAKSADGGSGVGGDDGNHSAAEDLDKGLEILCVLVKAHADAETLVAALASQIIRNPLGRYNLEVIEEQFGPIIRGIVEDRLMLERLPAPMSAQSYLAVRQSRGVKPVLDLDDYHAKLMRDYLVHSSRDARAVVVHMADLTYRLRHGGKTPAHARHSIALEAIQLYVPVSNALGLGSSFRELEELGYKTIFPQTYSEMALWHLDVKSRSHDIVLDVKKRMLEALNAREDIASRVQSYHLEGRTKGLVSTFRKVFRQNKNAADVHDIIGFRIIVLPTVEGTVVPGGAHTKQRGKGKGGGYEEKRVEMTRSSRGRKRPLEKRDGSKPARTVYTVKTFPPPYRDADSRLLHDVYEVLVGLFDEVPGRFKNYVDFPKKNGYRSVHTTVVHSTGLMMEFQVRTANMHAEAEGGTASHSLYKGNLENPEEASLFRSKMARNILSPSHRRLPAKANNSAARSGKGASNKVAAAQAAAMPVLGAETEKLGTEARRAVSPAVENSDRSREP